MENIDAFSALREKGKTDSIRKIKLNGRNKHEIFINMRGLRHILCLCFGFKRASGNEFKILEIPEKYNMDTSLEDKDQRIPPFMKLLDDLTKSLDDGKSRSPSLEDGWRNQQLLDAVKDSHRTGARIIIPR